MYDCAAPLNRLHDDDTNLDTKQDMSRSLGTNTNYKQPNTLLGMKLCSSMSIVYLKAVACTRILLTLMALYHWHLLSLVHKWP